MAAALNRLHLRLDAALYREVEAELKSAYADTGYEHRSVDQLVDHALAVVAADTIERANDQATCMKVDECTATAIILRKLARLISPETVDAIEAGESHA